MADNAKFCMSCGAHLTLGSDFCPNCGSKVADGASAAASQETSVEDFGATTVLDGAQSPFDANVPADPFVQNAEEQAPEAFSPNVGYIPDAPVSPVPFAPEAVQEAPVKPKKNIKKPIIICAVLVVIIAILGVIGGVYAHFASSPFLKLGKGMQKLFTSGKTYAITAEHGISYENNSGETVKSSDKYKADVKFDFENRYMAVGNLSYQEIFQGETDDEYEMDTVKGYIDCKNNEIGFYLRNDDGDEIYFFNGIGSGSAEDAVEHKLILSEENMAKIYPVVGDLMAALAGEKIDEDEFQKKCVELLTPIIEMSGVDITEIPNLNDVVSEKTVKSIEKKLTKALTDKKWLEENFGYEKTKEDGETIYSFKLNYKSVRAITDLLEDDAFAAAEEMFDYMQKNYPELLEDIDAEDVDFDEIKDEYKEELSDLLDEMKEYKYSASFRFGIKKGVLSSVQIKIDDEVFKLTIEETDDLSVKASDCNKYYEEAKEDTKDDHDIFVSIKDDNCRSNMYGLAYAVETCYNRTGKVPATEDDFKAYMYDGKVPACPWNNKAYKINIDENTGIVKIECTDPECANSKEPYEYTYKSVYDYGYDDDYGYGYDDNYGHGYGDDDYLLW